MPCITTAILFLFLLLLYPHLLHVSLENILPCRCTFSLYRKLSQGIAKVLQFALHPYWLYSNVHINVWVVDKNFVIRTQLHRYYYFQQNITWISRLYHSSRYNSKTQNSSDRKCSVEISTHWNDWCPCDKNFFLSKWWKIVGRYSTLIWGEKVIPSFSIVIKNEMARMTCCLFITNLSSS